MNDKRFHKTSRNEKKRKIISNTKIFCSFLYFEYSYEQNSFIIFFLCKNYD